MTTDIFHLVLPDIPRFYTALAEWLACFVCVFWIKRRVKGWKFVLCSGVALALQSLFLIMTGNLQGILWMVCMLTAIGMMYLYIMICGDLNWKDGLYYCMGAFVAAEAAASLEWQFYCFFYFGRNAEMEKEGIAMKNTDKEFLRTEPLGRLLFKLAVPTVAAQLINMLYNIIDRIYIGHIPNVGSAALTGVGVCMPLILIVSAFAALVGAGGAPRASIFMGKQDKESAEKILGNCFALQIMISIVLTIVLLTCSTDLLMAFGASENTIEYGVDYMNIYALGTLFVELTLGMNTFITAQGFAKTGMLSVLIGAVSNIILDPVFIFGFRMGVRGAALATVISQGLSCIWVVSFLCGKKTFLRIRKENLILVPKVILPCLALGVATFIMQASESVISVCFNSSLQKYGEDIAVGAMTILTSVMQFAMLPLQGLGQGAQPIISYNFGARDAGRVRAAFKLLLKVSLGYAAVLWMIVMLFPGIFAGMFTSDAVLLEFTKSALRIYMAVMVLFGIQIACQLTFNALGKAAESIIVAVMRKFVLLIPLIYIMPQIMSSDKTMAVYMAEPIADFLAVTFTAILFTVQFRKTLRKIEEPQGEIRK